MAQGRPQAPFDAAAYCIPGEISIHDVRDMKKAFDMLDEDQSGLIDAEELQGAAIALGIPEAKDNIATLLGAQKITFDDFFQRMTAKLTTEDKADDILNIFELFDTDRTGTISFQNMRDVGKLIGAGEDNAAIQDCLNLLDSDGDGELDPHDFYTCLVSGMRIRLAEEERIREAELKQAAEDGQVALQAGFGRSASGLSASGVRASGQLTYGR